MYRFVILAILCVLTSIISCFPPGTDERSTNADSALDSLTAERRLFELLRDSVEWEDGFDSLETEEMIRFFFRRPPLHLEWPDTNQYGYPAGGLGWSFFCKRYLTFMMRRPDLVYDSSSFTQLLLEHVTYDYPAADSAQIAAVFAYRLSRLTGEAPLTDGDSLSLYDIFALGIDTLVSLAESAELNGNHRQARFYWHLANGRLEAEVDSQRAELRTRIDSILGITRYTRTKDFDKLGKGEWSADSHDWETVWLNDSDFSFADDDRETRWYGFDPYYYSFDWPDTNDTDWRQSHLPWYTFRFHFLLATYYADEPVNDSASLADEIRSRLGPSDTLASERIADSIVSARLAYLSAKPYRAGKPRLSFFDLLGLDLDSLLSLAESAKAAKQRSHLSSVGQG